MALTKRLSGFRFVEIQQGDTLQKIAKREFGAASLWPELVDINGLVPPYLTGDPAQASDKVKLYGDSLMVPASQVASSAVAAAADYGLVFGTDLALTDGRLTVGPNGDLALVSGVANLKQAVKNRIDTPLGELLFHDTYGCNVHSLKGQPGVAGSTTLGAQYVKSALMSDTRISSVPSAKAALVGDAITIEATARAVTGTSIDIATTG